MSQIVLRTSMSDPFGGGHADCDCAVVDVTADLVKFIQQRTAIARRAVDSDRHLYELMFVLGYEPEFYNSRLLEACSVANRHFDERFSEEGWATLPRAVRRQQFNPERTECQQMIVRIDRISGAEVRFEIAWSAIPKHTELTITTAAVPISRLREFVSPRRKSRAH